MMKPPSGKIARLALGLATTAVAAAALWLTPRAREQSSASAKPSHHGGSGGGSGGGTFYAIATNVTQLAADINYANTVGGTFTINLQPNTTFVGRLPGIRGPKTRKATISGKGSTSKWENRSRLFVVGRGS